MPTDKALRFFIDALMQVRPLSDDEQRTIERRLVELVMLVGHYEMLATTLGTLRVQPDAPRRRSQRV